MDKAIAILRAAGIPNLDTVKFVNEPVSEEERLQRQCDDYNASRGTLEGYDCAECRNKGYIMRVKDFNTVLRVCGCKPAREAYYNIQRSGLADMLETKTFDTFEAVETWERDIKQAAMEFAENPAGKWFFIGGQPGSGKTHICTAIAGELLKKRMSVRYMRWVNELSKFNNPGLDYDTRERMRWTWMDAPVLYIDDFLKHSKGNKPTDAEIRFALDLIDYRYCDRELITIISGELYIEELIDIDEALGSRIKARSPYRKAVPRDVKKNRRLRG